MGGKGTNEIGRRQVDRAPVRCIALYSYATLPQLRWLRALFFVQYLSISRSRATWSLGKPDMLLSKEEGQEEEYRRAAFGKY